MRITVLIVVALVVLAGAGVFGLSQLVEADDLRRELIREAEAVTGHEFAVEGRVDLKLLPRPTLTVAAATLGRTLSTTDGVQLEIDRMDLEVKPLPLLRGDVEVDAVRLVRPVLRVREAQLERLRMGDLLEDGGLPLALLSAGRLSVIDGQATLEDGVASGGRVFEAINIEVVAQDDRGPFAIDGAFELGEQPFRLNARLGRPTGDLSTTLQVEVAAAGAEAAAGHLAFRGVASGGRVARLRGRLTMQGDDARRGIGVLARALGHDAPALPAWLERPYQISGSLASLDQQLEISELAVGFAGAEATGRLEVAMAPARPTVDVALDMARLDLAGPPEDAWRGAALLRGLSTLAAGELDLTVGLLGFRGETARRLRLTVAMPRPGMVRIEQARAILPGNADVSFKGALAGENGPELQGELVAVTDRLRTLLAWLDLEPEAVAAGRLQSLSLSSKLAADPAGLRLFEIEARVDGARVAGSVALGLGRRPRIAAALDLDRLDVDAYLPEATPEIAAASVQHWLTATDAALQLAVERLTWRDLRWEGVAMEGRSVDGRLVLDEMTAKGLADATVRLGGEVDFIAENFDLDGHLEAPRPALLLRRLGLEPPLALARMTPLVLDGSARGWREDTSVEIEVALAEATLDLAGDLAWPDDDPLSYLLEAEASHPDFAALLDALGASWQPAGEQPKGPFRLTGRVRRQAGVPFGIVGSADLGPTRITGEATFETGPARPVLNARLSLGDPRIETLAPLLDVAGLRLDRAALAEGVVGRWPQVPLDLGWLGDADGTLALTGKGGLAGEGLELKATLDDRLLMVERFATDALGGDVAIEASLDMRRTVTPVFSMATRFSAIDAAALLGRLGLAPVLEGEGEVYAEATASGRSAYELMRSLAADLEVGVDDGRLTLPGLLTGDDARTYPVEGFASEFDVKRGILETDGIDIDLGDATARVSGTVDAFLWVADLTVALAPDDDDATSRAIRIVGPLDAPQVVPLPPSTVEMPKPPVSPQAGEPAGGL